MEARNLEYLFMKEVGLLISNLRDEKNITKQEFAKITGLNRQHLYYVEIGKRATTIYTLSIITDVLEVSLSDFFMQLEERMKDNECI